MVIVSYVDQDGREVNQFAIAGDNNVMLLDSRSIGLGTARTPSGFATGWLRAQILEALGRDPSETPQISSGIPIEEAQ